MEFTSTHLFAVLHFINAAVHAVLLAYFAYTVFAVYNISAVIGG